MPKFSKASQKALDSCVSPLQDLFNEVVKHYDCKILEGHRGKEAQNVAYAKGLSKKRWPNGKHNSVPSKAVDVAPYPVQWPGPGLSSQENQRRTIRFYHFIGFVAGVASQMGISIRCGADWDSDEELFDQTFNDLPHFELRQP